MNLPGILLWGSGVDHPLYPVISNMTNGYPTVNGLVNLTGGDITVTGIFMNGAEIAVGSNNCVVEMNRMNNPSGNGVNITGGDNITITGNTILNGDINSNIAGIKINGGTTLNIFNNSIDGYFFGIYASGGTGIDITGNTIHMNRYGIHLYYTDSPITDVVISGNEITKTNTLYSFVGIALQSISGGSCNIGTPALPIYITNNIMNAVASNGSPRGIVMISHGNLFASMTGNEMNMVSPGNYSIGAQLMAQGTIGSVGYPTIFSNNTGVLDGNSARYILFLDDGLPGSSINWGGNVFTPLDSGVPANWSGDYPVSPGPVDTIFFGYGGILNP